MKFFTGISQVFCLLMFLGTPIEWFILPGEFKCENTAIQTI